MSQPGLDNAHYIGDGVYVMKCSIDPNAFEIFTYDGVYRSNIIYIDRSVLISMLQWINKEWEGTLHAAS